MAKRKRERKSEAKVRVCPWCNLANSGRAARCKDCGTELLRGGQRPAHEPTQQEIAKAAAAIRDTWPDGLEQRAVNRPRKT